VFLEPIEIGAKPISRMTRAGDLDQEGRPSGGAFERKTKKRKVETLSLEDTIMKTWTKPAVREQEVGLEVTSYLPAEIDVI
jgi:coenzyme PQQ precursor peptide PqqA